jgi:SAM-dependent methyltransferase
MAYCSALLIDFGTPNPRRAGLHNNVIQLVKKGIARSLSWYTRSIRRSFREIVAALAAHETELKRVRKQLRAQQKTMDRLTAELAIRAQAVADPQRGTLASHDSSVGPKTRAGLGFNESTAVEYDARCDSSWATSNERIIEKSWVFRHFPPVGAGIRVLDLGCAESRAALELASNGYRVTGIDMQPCPFRHPNFDFVLGNLCTSGLAGNSFDVVLALSTIEHIGLGAGGDTGEELPDRAAMREVHRVLKDGGRLLLTVPFGRRAVTPLHRIYDLESLRSLLAGFETEVIEYGVKLDGKTWQCPAAEEDAVLRTHDPTCYSPGAVALIVCRKMVE